MKVITVILIAFVAIEHLLILYIEMFAWERVGSKVFREMPAQMFRPTRAMAANQGLYNGFLAAGLTWSLFITDPVWSFRTAMFFLICIIVAAVFGSVTVSRKIVLVQGLPAVLALLSLAVGR